METETKRMEGGKVIHSVSPPKGPGSPDSVTWPLGPRSGSAGHLLEQIWNEPVGEVEESRAGPRSSSPQDLAPVVTPQPREHGPYCAHSGSTAIFSPLPPFRSTSLFFRLF